MTSKGRSLNGLAMRSYGVATGTPSRMPACSISTTGIPTIATTMSASADPSKQSLDVGAPTEGNHLVENIPQATAKARQQAKPKTAAAPPGSVVESGKINQVSIGKSTLINVDCMEYMAGLPDKSFDLAIVDPPYGIKMDGHRDNNRSKLAASLKYHKALWEQAPPQQKFFRELERVSKNQIIWGGNHLAALIAKNSSCWIVWDKHTSGSFADCELAYTSFTTAVRKFDYPWNGMIQGFHGNKAKNETRIHPTQKPVALYQWVLTNYAEPGQRILDTHSGSGSLAIAANNLGFELVATEIDEVYFNDSINRIIQAAAQERLFI